MPAPKSTRQRSETFGKFEVSRQQFGENNDCGVKAVAAAAGLHYAEAHKLLEAKGRQKGKGTPILQIESVLYELGYKLINEYGQQVDLCVNFLDGFNPKYFINHYPAAHQVLKSVTTHHPERFPKAECWKNRTFLMMTDQGGNIVCVKNGETMDWTQGKAKRANKIVEVVPR